MTKLSKEKSKEIDLTSQYRAIGIPAVKAALLSKTIVTVPTMEKLSEVHRAYGEGS